MTVVDAAAEMSDTLENPSDAFGFVVLKQLFHLMPSILFNTSSGFSAH